MINIDTTRLDNVRPAKQIFCEITDLDPLSRGAGTIPREVEVQLRDQDGPKQVAMWRGFPAIAVGSEVRCWRASGDTHVLEIAGAGGSDRSAGGGSWPASGEIINATTTSVYSDFSTAVTAASAGDTLLLGPGSFTETSNVVISSDMEFVGSGIDVTTLTFSLVDGAGIEVNGNGNDVYLNNMTIASSANSATDNHVLEASSLGSIHLFNCAILAANASSGTAAGIRVGDGTTSAGKLFATLVEFRAGVGEDWAVYSSNHATNRVELFYCDASDSFIDSVEINNGTIKIFGGIYNSGVNIVTAHTQQGYFYDIPLAGMRLLGETSLQMPERTSDPSTPPTGEWILYFKNSGLHVIDDAGTVTRLGPEFVILESEAVTVAEAVTVSVV